MSSNEDTQEADCRQHILASTPCDATSNLNDFGIAPTKAFIFD